MRESTSSAGATDYGREYNGNATEIAKSGAVKSDWRIGYYYLNLDKTENFRIELSEHLWYDRVFLMENLMGSKIIVLCF